MDAFAICFVVMRGIHDGLSRFFPAVRVKLIACGHFFVVTGAGKSRRGSNRRNAQGGNEQKNQQRF
jgi:hypothetical protein